jgi:retron-type reverse transcriptase
MISKGRQIFLWAIGVLQPTNATLVRHFLVSTMNDMFNGLRTQDIKDVFKELQKQSLIAPSSSKSPYLFSLTSKGNWAMENKLRRLRDKTRLFLLRDAAKAAVRAELSERGLELTGASPVLDKRTDMQGRRPVVPAVGDPYVRAYWPSTFKQLKLSVSAGPLPRSDYSIGFDYYSFETISELSEASLTPPHFLYNSRYDLTISQLALAIGISARLLSAMASTKKHRHYRVFEIKKQSGGARVIHAPRVFLKTVQRWILDYVLFKLPSHESCHSYIAGRSILTNASLHTGKKFVANLDIVDFFGSIKEQALRACLFRVFGPSLVKSITSLCTYNGALPQGAPTSPTLSNFFLFEFDNEMSEYCTLNGLTYSRYADDITISGNDKELICSAIDTVRRLLAAQQLQVNEKKTRIASRGGQQNVTGVVVNVVPQPPRRLRKLVRAMFHKAEHNLQNSAALYSSLAGYCSYIKSFPHCSGSKSVLHYESVLDSVKQEIK